MLLERPIDFAEKWLPQKLWDIHTPQNMFTIELSLLDAKGKVLDTFWRERLGFRELWIEGRDRFHERVRYERRLDARDAYTFQTGRWQWQRLQP